MRLGLDGWATNALQTATEESRRAARMLSSVTARFGYVVETVSGVACLVAWLRVAVDAAQAVLLLRRHNNS